MTDNSGHGHWPTGQKSKTDSTKVPSALLALTGLAIVAIQTYIFTTFGDGGVANSYAPFFFYNGMAIASGTVGCITGLLCLCCCVSSKRSSSTLGFSVFMTVLAAVGAIGSTAVSVMESSRIGTDDPQHPCTTVILFTINCSLWLDLQIAVAVLSAVSFILAFTLTILITMGIRQLKVRMTHLPSTNADVQWRPASVLEMVEIEPHHPEEIPPVIVEKVTVEIAQESSSISTSTSNSTSISEEEEENRESVNNTNNRGPYIEQLKMLSREELERRLGEHMQHQFLDELRQELGKRNLIPINGRLGAASRSTTSSTKSRVSDHQQPVPAPQPDYYQEPLGYKKDERF